jgi:hypothetical protein
MNPSATPLALDGQVSGTLLAARELYPSPRIERVAHGLILIGVAATTLGSV